MIKNLLQPYLETLPKNATCVCAIGTEEPQYLTGDINSALELSIKKGGLKFSRYDLPTPLLINDFNNGGLPSEVLKQAAAKGIRACAVICIEKGDTRIGWLGVFSSEPQRWSKNDLVALFDAAETVRTYAATNAAKTPYFEILPVAAAVISTNRKIQRVNQKFQSITGEYAERLVGKSLSEISIFRNTEDLDDLFKEVFENPSERTLRIADYQIQIVPATIEDESVVLVCLLPQGVDHEIGVESEDLPNTFDRSLKAILEIVKEFQNPSDPSNVMISGLRTIMNATGADGGVILSFDRLSGVIEVVVSEGLSLEYLDALEKRAVQGGVVRSVIETGVGMLVPDMYNDSRAVGKVARIDKVRASIVIPLFHNGISVGGLALYSRTPGIFSQEHFNLATLGGYALSAASRHAEYIAAEKRDARALSFLYRLSHALGKERTIKEISSRALEVISDEIMLKRTWIGVMNERQTHIIGQAGFGEGVRRRLQNMQIERALRHEGLDEALETQQPVILEAGRRVDCSALNRVMQRLELGTLVIVPLIVLGKSVGALIIEPENATQFFSEKQLPLMMRAASEIATIIFTRIVQAQASESEKAKIAGTITTGIAHHFNNLLQAVMGQASMIQVHVPQGSEVAKAAQTIIDSTHKGATLIQQLRSFSSAEKTRKNKVKIQSLIKDSETSFRELLGKSINLKLEGNFEGEIYGDLSQLKLAIKNVLARAKEALLSVNDGKVVIASRLLRIYSDDIDPDLVAGSYVEILIRDNGIYMEPEEQARCFEPFFTPQNTSSGIGFKEGGARLGLASAYSIVKSHYGLITVRSEKKKGTAFTIYLPLTGELAASDEIKKVIREKTVQVMLLNCSAHDVDMITSELKTVGVSAVPSTRWRRGIEFAKAETHAAKVLFLDVDQVPFEVRGYIVALRAEDSLIRIVVVTEERQRWSSELRNLDAIEIIEKPLSEWAVKGIIQRFVHNEPITPLTSQISVEVSHNEGKPSTSNRD